MATSSAKRVRQHRDGLRAAGLRPMQIWVPDTRRPGFAQECARQSRLVSDSPSETEVLDWIEAAFDDSGWAD